MQIYNLFHRKTILISKGISGFRKFRWYQWLRFFWEKFGLKKFITHSNLCKSRMQDKPAFFENRKKRPIGNNIIQITKIKVAQDESVLASYLKSAILYYHYTKAMVRTQKTQTQNKPAQNTQRLKYSDQDLNFWFFFKNSHFLTCRSKGYHRL